MKFPLFSFMNKSLVARTLVFLVCVAAVAISVSAQKNSLAPEAIGIDIEQCANGPISAPINCDVSSGNQGYVRGAVNESKSHYFEGDFLPIRFIASDLVVGQAYTVTLGYDYTKGGKYATDYLGSYDYTEDNPIPNPPYENNPCVNVVGCNIATPVLFAVPLDPQVALGFNGVDDAPPGPTGGDDIVQIPGSFSCFGCHITSISAYTLDGSIAGDSSKTFTISFIADATNIVIAYGSHISTRTDWGQLNSAINISGSPYHNFVVDFPGANGGSRDLQLSASAVIFPASVTIIKAVTTALPGFPPGDTSTFEFDYTASSNLGDPDDAFTLIDNVAGAGGGGTASVGYSGLILFGSGNSITVTEANYLPTWTLSGITCTEDRTANSTGNTGTRTATIILEEGEAVTCTFFNTQLQPTAAPASVSGRVTDSFGNGIGGARLSLLDAQSGNTWSVITSSFGYYTIEGVEIGNFYVLTVGHKRYEFADNTRTFTLNDNLDGIDFTANP